MHLLSLLNVQNLFRGPLKEKFGCMIKFSEQLDKIDWNALLSNLEDEVFTATLLLVARECIPTKLVTIHINDKPCKLRKEIRIRDGIRKQVQRFNYDSDIIKYKKKEIK